jgi:hypothetical protein
MPSSGNLPLQFNRERVERQLDARLEELLAKLRKNRPSEDPWMVRRAYEIAAERHRGQVRSSGEPYLTHLLEVAHILRGYAAGCNHADGCHSARRDRRYGVSAFPHSHGSKACGVGCNSKPVLMEMWHKIGHSRQKLKN